MEGGDPKHKFTTKTEHHDNIQTCPILHGNGGIQPSTVPTMDAGMAKFVRDGVWVNGQEEMWIEKGWNILVKTS